MGLLLKWGNWFVAKLLELLFNTSYLSDVGCTYRMIRRPALASYRKCRGVLPERQSQHDRQAKRQALEPEPPS